VDGEPYGADKTDLGLEECFPEAAKYELGEDGELSSKRTEPIAADAREGKDGKGNVLLKLVAGLLDVRFDDLKQRDQARKQKRLAIFSAFSFALVAVMAGLTFWAFEQQQKAKIAEEVAVKARKEAEWKSYVNHIALADAKIKEGDITKAENILWDAWKSNREYCNWEWGRLMMTADLSLLTINHNSQGGHVESAMFSPNGNEILVARWYSSIKIHSAQTGKVIKNFSGHRGKVYKAVYSSDGSKIISTGEDATIRIWDVKTQKELHRINLAIEKPKSITDISFTQDDQSFAASNINGTVMIWEVGTWRLLRKLDYSPLKIFSFAFSPDGKTLVSSHNRGTVCLTDLTTGIIKQYKKHQGDVRIAKFSPDGEKILSIDRAQMAKIWYLQTKKEITITNTHEKEIHSASFSPNGNKIATASQDKTARFFSAWDGYKSKSIKGHPLPLTGIDFHPDGKRILTSSKDGKVKIWPVHEEEKTNVICRQKSVSSFDISSDSKKLLVVSGAEAKFWDIKSRKELPVRIVNSGTIQTAFFSPDGTMVISTSDDNTSIIWDAQTGKRIRTLSGHSDLVNFAAFSPDGRVVVTTSNDHTAKIWDVKTGSEIKSLEHSGPVLNASFDSASTQLVTVLKDQPALAWDWKNKRVISNLAKHHNAIFADKNHILCTNQYSKKAYIRHTETGKIKFELSGHNEGIRSAFYSSDGKRIVTTSQDNTTKIWDAKSGQELLSLTLNLGRLRSVKFSPYGRSIIFIKDKGQKMDDEICVWEAYKWENTPSIHIFKRQRYADWLKANEYEVDKN
jgi:WD40 repeat protein